MTTMNLVLHVWRQKNTQAKGAFARYEAKNVSEHSSFLEMLDQVNEELLGKGEPPIAFDHDCREGICGTRGMVVDRGAFDRIIQAGGYISARAGSPPDGNAIPVPKEDADRAMDAAACIGCGACVAACPNASAMLFTAAKAGHLNLLPQGKPEQERRVLGMVSQMEEEGFGHCTNHYECMSACPKGIDVDFIAKLNRDFVRASLTSRGEQESAGGDG